MSFKLTAALCLLVGIIGGASWAASESARESVVGSTGQTPDCCQLQLECCNPPSACCELAVKPNCCAEGQECCELRLPCCEAKAGCELCAEAKCCEAAGKSADPQLAATEAAVQATPAAAPEASLQP